MKTKKKGFVIGVVIAAIFLAAAVFLILRFSVPYLRRHYQPVHVVESEVTAGEKVELEGQRILTVYFTRAGNTDFADDVDAVSGASLMLDGDRLIGNSELLAKMVQNSVGGDLYAITTEKKYPSSYNDTVSEAAEENKQEGLLALAGELPDMKEYDTVFFVYPVWWGTLPKAVSSFVKQVDLDAKTIYVVATHGGSGLAGSMADLQKETNGIVKEPALEVYDDDVAKALPQVTKWLKGLAGEQ